MISSLRQNGNISTLLFMFQHILTDLSNVLRERKTKILLQSCIVGDIERLLNSAYSLKHKPASDCSFTHVISPTWFSCSLVAAKRHFEFLIQISGEVQDLTIFES